MVIVTKEMAEILRVEAVTVRKYADILEKSGYIIARNDSGHRVYSEKDVTVFRQLQELRQHSGMNLESASKLIASRERQEYETVSPTVLQPIQEQLVRYEEQYGELKQLMLSMAEQNRHQGEESERQTQELERLNKKLEDQNNNISVILREVLESRRLAAASQENKKSWWKFWQREEVAPGRDPETVWNQKMEGESSLYERPDRGKK